VLPTSRASLIVLSLMLPALAFAMSAASDPGPAAFGTGPATFDHYTTPFGGGAGETSIGVNPRTNNVFFQRLFHTDRIHFDDSTTPPAATWTDVSPDLQITTFDPIGYTDRVSGRTYVVHLLLAGSQEFVTQDIPGVLGQPPLVQDGDVWVPTQLPTSFPFFDHETVGAGPHAIVPNLNPVGQSLGLEAVTGSANAMYYCGQLGLTVCARSDDDGVTWGPYVPINLLDTCGGLVGHVVVDATGVAYVPNKDCGANGQGVEISRDNGNTWNTRYIPGSNTNGFRTPDPNIAIGNDDNVYMALRTNNRPTFTKSTDHGVTWSATASVDPTGTIVNTMFPEMAAGDAGRAVMTFYGSTQAGDDQSSGYTGVWHLYASFTFNGGASWTLYDLTPSDPVQRGCIWMQGGGNPCRNLLDFQGTTYDAKGRVVVGYADGCVSATCVGPTGTPADSRNSLGKVARQTSGKGLLAAFDTGP
jgi:hypothetical protein